MNSFGPSLRRRAKWLLTSVLGLAAWAADHLVAHVFVEWVRSFADRPGLKSFFARLLIWSVANPVGSVLILAAVIFVGITLLAYLRPISAARQTAEVISTSKIDQNLPNVVALPPRLAYVQATESGGLIEYAGVGGRSDQILVAALAGFRNSPRPAGHDPSIESATAHLTYFDSRGTEVQRVNHGMWVGEDFNSTDMLVGQTRELILAVWSESDQVTALDDRRESTEKYLPLLPRPLPKERELNVTTELFVEDENGKQSVRRFRHRLNTQKPTISS